MILYKYVTFKGALRLIDEKTVRYTPAIEFNDPLELLHSVSDSAAHATKAMLASIFMDNYGSLCLTTNPKNVTMWTHYSSSDLDEFESEKHHDLMELFKNPKQIWPRYKTKRYHNGMVFEFDTELAGFDSDNHMVKASNGKVSYSKSPPPTIIESINSDLIQSPRGQLFERVFLNKSDTWSYEEEYRSVIDIASDDEQFKGVREIPKNCVTGVYLGLAISGNQELVQRLKAIINETFPESNVYEAIYIENNWGIDFKLVS